MANEIISAILMSVRIENGTVVINYYHNYDYQKKELLNPEIITGTLLTGTEIRLAVDESRAELLLSGDEYIPEVFAGMIDARPPALSTFFGLISKPENGRGRYYMLRDHNADGLLLCTGEYRINKGKARCLKFDCKWALRYNLVENFFYGFKRPEYDARKWSHPEIKLKKIDETLTIRQLTKKHRNYAAGWHRFNFFSSNDWSEGFYKKQAKLGYIAITHTEDGRTKLTPQLQREYAVLDWPNLKIDRKVKKIINSGRMVNENIKLEINGDPSEVLQHLSSAWQETWITVQYTELIKKIASDMTEKKRGIKIWGVTLSAGIENEVIAGELGYTIGKTYTSLSGFFHRENHEYNNFGKLQMVLLAEHLEKSGILFWNLGQPYMDYKIRLGAEVVPRGLFLKRWDKAVRGRTVDLNSACKNKENNLNNL